MSPLIKLLSTIMICLTNADYQIGYIVRSFEYIDSQNNNTLADGSCCDSTCSDDTCCLSTNTTCSPTLRICVREPNHPSDDREAPCFQRTIRRNANQVLIVLSTSSSPIQRCYTGGYQLYVRISHFNGAGTPDFNPPFSDPLIDELFFEFNISSVLFSDRFIQTTQVLDVAGIFQRIMMRMSATLHCADGWSGIGCDTSPIDITSDLCVLKNEPAFNETSTSNESSDVPPTGDGVTSEGSDEAISMAVGTLTLLAILIVLFTITVIINSIK